MHNFFYSVLFDNSKEQDYNGHIVREVIRTAGKQDLNIFTVELNGNLLWVGAFKNRIRQ